MTHKTYAEQLADYSARRDAFEDEGYPQSYEQWRKLEADRRAEPVNAKRSSVWL